MYTSHQFIMSSSLTELEHLSTETHYFITSCFSLILLQVYNQNIIWNILVLYEFHFSKVKRILKNICYKKVIQALIGLGTCALQRTLFKAWQDLTNQVSIQIHTLVFGDHVRLSLCSSLGHTSVPMQNFVPSFDKYVLGASGSNYL